MFHLTSPRNVTGTHFWLSLSRLQGRVQPEGLCQWKKSNDTIGNRTCYLPTWTSLPFRVDAPKITITLQKLFYLNSGYNLPVVKLTYMYFARQSEKLHFRTYPFSFLLWHFQAEPSLASNRSCFFLCRDWLKINTGLYLRIKGRKILVLTVKLVKVVSLTDSKKKLKSKMEKWILRHLT